MKKPRALIFSIKRNYINPSFNILLKVLSEVFEVTFYGPGYDEVRYLDNDLYEVYNQLGPFDAVFIDQWLYSNPERHVLKTLFTSRSLNFTKSARKYADNVDFGKGFSKIPVDKFLFSWIDLYSCTKEEGDDLKDFPGYIFGCPLYLAAPNSLLEENQSKEKFPFTATDYYEKSLSDRERDIIPFCHVIEDKEIKLNSSIWKVDISVPGFPYYERKLIYNYLKNEAKLNVLQKQNMQSYIENIACRLPINFTNKKPYIFIQQKFFRKLIRQSFCSYTDGSQFDYPLRKFFEIPALGSILLARPFHNCHKMGFKDRENFFNVSASNILDIYSELRQNPEYANQVRNNARNLIIKSHSKDAWVGYLSEIWGAIKAGSFYGCEWENGKICVRRKQ